VADARLLGRRPRIAGPLRDTAPVVRLVAGSVFVAFGVGKFTDRESEARSLDNYGLPAPSEFASAGPRSDQPRSRAGSTPRHALPGLDGAGRFALDERLAPPPQAY
jgi:hypothetical protein